MIKIKCKCGMQFEVLNEQVALRARCPRCGVVAVESMNGIPSSRVGTSHNEPEHVVACVHHRDHAATHNCMNCGKPLCADCVTANGYYCSDTCKNVVRTTAPSLDQSLGSKRFDRKVEQTADVIGTLLRSTKVIVPVALICIVGYFGYQYFFAPRPQVSAGMKFDTGAGILKTQTLDRNVVICQARDELFAADIASQEKLWTVNLTEIAADTSDPRPTGDTEGYYDYVDQLQLLNIVDEIGIIHSSQQIVALNMRTGDVLWRFHPRTGYVNRVQIYNAGVVCLLNGGTTGSKSQVRLLNLSLTDGHQQWSRPVKRELSNPLLVSDNQIFLLQGESEWHAGLIPSDQEGIDIYEDFDDEYDEDEESARLRKFTMEAIGLADGKKLAEQATQLQWGHKLNQFDSHYCLASGNILSVFTKDLEPAWKLSLETRIKSVSGNTDLILAGTKDKLIGFNTNTGEQLWVRDNIDVDQIWFAPDDNIYVTIQIPRDQANNGEVAGYRIADVAAGGISLQEPMITALLRLDPQSGQTLWGVKHIGREVRFSNGGLYTVDRTMRIGLLESDTFNLVVGNYSIHKLSPSNSKDLWSYTAKGDLHDYEISNDKVILAASHQAPYGDRMTFELQIVEGK